jgi:phage terminase large subunit
MIRRALTEKEIDTLRWWKDWRETNNEKFARMIFDKHRYLVFKGGGGSGKSIYAGRHILERCTTEPGHRWLVVRKVGRTLRESCFEQLRSQAYEHYADSVDFIPRGKSGDMYIRLCNGSEIIFSGLDDAEKLKSIYDITGIWIEEASELDEADFNQLDIRLRTEFRYHLQLILTFNPISITHWLKRRFFDKRDERATIHESTYKDNRFLQEEAIRVLEGFKDTDPYYYTVYCLGQWGVTGKTVFNGQQLTERLQQLSGQKSRRGFFTYEDRGDGIHIKNWAFAEDEDGPIRIYKEPVAGRPYVIGGDTAGEGSDWFTAQVLDNITGEQMATLRHQYDEDTYARQLYCLGHFYNEALIGPETNFSTYPTKLLNLMGYNKLFVREVEDEYTGQLRHSFGFQTNKLTRPVIISELIRIIRDHAALLHDEQTIMEMLSFVRNDKLRPEAEPGAHDDLVLALAIAYYIRPQQSMELRVEQKVKTAKWTADMWEDYRSAGPELREIMLKEWGKPQ